MKSQAVPLGLSTPGRGRLQEVSDDFGARLGTEVGFVVDADFDCIGFHVAFANHEHGVDFHLLGTLNVPIDVVCAFVELATDLVCAQLI